MYVSIVIGVFDVYSLVCCWKIECTLPLLPRKQNKTQEVPNTSFKIGKFVCKSVMERYQFGYTRQSQKRKHSNWVHSFYLHCATEIARFCVFASTFARPLSKMCAVHERSLPIQNLLLFTTSYCKFELKRNNSTKQFFYSHASNSKQTWRRPYPSRVR